MRISPSSPNFHAVSARPMDAAASSARQVDHSRGYPVGDGTFASSVRGTAPQRERDLQLAMMSNDAYKSDAPDKTGTQSERELENAGWRRLRPEGDHLVDAQGNRIPISAADLHNPTTGFDAAIYQNAQGQYVVAYRGTDNWSPGAGGDLTTNINKRLPWPRMPKKYSAKAMWFSRGIHWEAAWLPPPCWQQARPALLSMRRG